jgi:uncharacterized protein (DUF488 family)
MQLSLYSEPQVDGRIIARRGEVAPMNDDGEGEHPAGQLTLYTIGHSNSTAAGLIDLLRRVPVALVVDVRSAPYSRYTPHFNREPLQQALREAGIDYVFAGEYLGGRPTDPTCYYDGQIPDGKANYLKLVNYAAVAERPWYRRGIERLLQLARARPTAIMCSEEDPAHCHRHHLIATTLLEQGVRVVHIRGTGDLESAQALQAATAAVERPQQLGLFEMN